MQLQYCYDKLSNTVCVESEEEEAEEEQVETHTSPEPAQDSAPYYESPPVRYVHLQVRAPT